MARILAISSYVAFGHVGLAAIVPTLQAMGHEVIAVPTVVLSCHYGYKEVGGFVLTSDQFGEVMSGISANEWHTTVDAVLTGYLPSIEVVEKLGVALARLGEINPDVLYLCDPVIGDDPNGLYVDEDVAAAIRDRLLPLADIVTPNRFELEWLSGLPVNSATDADLAAAEIDADLLVATSVPAGDGRIANVFSGEDNAGQAIVPREAFAPHGTGDLFAALLLGHMLDDVDHADAVARASAGVRLVIEASAGSRELRLIDNLDEAVVADWEALYPIDGGSE